MTSGIRIEMPNEARISIFTENNLTHITDDHTDNILQEQSQGFARIHTVNMK